MPTAPNSYANHVRENGPLRLNVPCLPLELVKALLEVEVEYLSVSGLCQIPTDLQFIWGLSSLSRFLLCQQIQLTTRW